VRETIAGFGCAYVPRRNMRMTAKKTRILVVDTNKVFAKMVKDTLGDHLVNSEIEIATTIYELRRRMRNNDYGLIIADFSVALDADEMLAEIQKSEKAIVIAWAPLQSKRTKTHPFLEISKPIGRAEITEAMPKILLGYK